MSLGITPISITESLIPPLATCVIPSNCPGLHYYQEATILRFVGVSSERHAQPITLGVQHIAY